MSRQFRLQPVVRGERDYRIKTTECLRMDMHELARPANAELHRGALAWIQGVLHAGGLAIDRRHWMDRLNGYLNKPSRGGDYLELVDAEFRVLQHFNAWLTEAKPGVQVVEVGWNAAGGVCKVSVVLQLPDTKRFMFLCVGADSGVKTFYVTPEYKYRAQYRVRDAHAVATVRSSTNQFPNRNTSVIESNVVSEQQHFPVTTSSPRRAPSVPPSSSPPSSSSWSSIVIRSSLPAPTSLSSEQ